MGSIVDTCPVTRSPYRSFSTPGVLAIVVAAALVLGACGGGPQPELVAAPATPTPEPTPVVEPTPEEPTPIVEPTAEVEGESEEATATPVPTPAPELWQVVDTVDNLNLRAEPSTSAQIVGAFGRGETGLVGTGARTNAEGRDWIELAADGDRPQGWVAAQFLAPDESTPPPAPTRVCFHTADGSNATTVALDFAADDTTFTGGVRMVIGENIEYEAVAGRRTSDSVFTVAVQAAGSGTPRTEEWASSADGLTMSDTNSAGSSTCDAVADLVQSIDVNVTDYPDVPA